jgi:2-dehydropantoate 2-reductase
MVTLIYHLSMLTTKPVECLCHRNISEEFIGQMLAYTLKMKPYRTSMKIDYDEGRPLEIAAMFGAPLQFARDRGVELPLIGMLYQQLQFLDAATERQSENATSDSV